MKDKDKKLTDKEVLDKIIEDSYKSFEILNSKINGKKDKEKD